jgi:hypothetical protein
MNKKTYKLRENWGEKGTEQEKSGSEEIFAIQHPQKSYDIKAFYL